MNQHDDRRHYPRVTQQLTIEVDSLDGRLPRCDRFQVADLSEGGLFIASGLEEVSVGDRLEVRVAGMLRDKAQSVPVTVVRSDAGGTALRFLS